MAGESRNAPESLLDEVIAAYVEAREAGEAHDRQALLVRHPELADELAAFFADEDQFDNLVAPLRAATPPLASGATPIDEKGDPLLAQAPTEITSPRRINDYEILGEIARGGMGVVYKARHRRLNRLVALKMILAGSFAAPAEVARFLREAESIARLDHPNLVPIYEIGEYEGQPFFAMKLIEGEDLSRHIKDFVERPRAAAELLRTIARAVHYAHQRGLLHRDLKPGNILLDKDGQPHVTDFGLAKRVADIEQAEQPTIARPCADTLEENPADPPLTRTGTAVGTPSYMAPEQALGKQADLTTAADVYSLGAILYELLTGQPPFRARSALETLGEALAREPDRPSVRNPRVSRDLETICLKCLEKEPARRYSSAAALADDLDRYLSGEPIEARPITRAERLVRWVRRQPVIAGLLAALFLSLSLGLALIAWKWREADANFRAMDEARQKADANYRAMDTQRALAVKHLAEAQRQKERAEKTLHQVRQIVEDFSIGLGGDGKRDLPGFQLLRRDALDKSIKYYEELLKEGPSSRELQTDLAMSYFQRGKLQLDLGSPSAARGDYERALEILRRLQRENPADPLPRDKLARTLINYALLQRGEGQSRQALESYAEAETLLRKLREERPQDPELKNALAAVYINKGSILRTEGNLPEATSTLQQAHTLLLELASRHPENLNFQRMLATSHMSLGALHDGKGNQEEALRSFQQALDIQEKLRKGSGKKTSRNVGLDLETAQCYRRVGDGLAALGRLPEALPALTESRTILEQLVKENPALAWLKGELATSVRKLANVIRKQGDGPAALELYGHAVALLKAQLQSHPTAVMQSELARTWFEIGLVHTSDRNWPDARHGYESARILQKKLMALQPDNADRHYSLGQTLVDLGLTDSYLGQTEQAVTELREAVAEHTLAVTRAPRIPKYQVSLLNAYVALARTLRKAGNAPEAQHCLVDAQRFFKQFAKAHPEIASAQENLATLEKLLRKGK
jgi:tetratricopeptide (TPR) repeat protein/tRNA A-37 threonylcarbamoyl transferase component Bud32